VGDPWETDSLQTLKDISSQAEGIRDHLDKTDPNHDPTEDICTSVQQLIAEIENPSGGHSGHILQFIGAISHTEEDYNINNNAPPSHQDPNGGNPYKEKVLQWFEIIDDTVRKLHSYLRLQGTDKPIPADPPNPTGTLDNDITAFVKDIAIVVDSIYYHIVVLHLHGLGGKGGPPAPYSRAKKRAREPRKR